MSLTVAAMTQRMESDEAFRVRRAWQRDMDAACRSGQKGEEIPAPLQFSSDYRHQMDGDAWALYQRNPALDLDEIENDFIRHSVEETGLSIPDEEQRRITDRLDELEAQSHELAERLETVGVPAYRQTPFGLWRYAIHSRTFRKIPAFRRICALPYVACNLRGSVVASLEYFLEKNPFCRFWTFSSGRRVPLRIPVFGPAEPLLRQRISYLNRKISKLNDQPFMKSAGLEIVFRSDEFGTPETDESGNLKGDAGTIERDPDGTIWLHVHCHCVVFPKKGYIPPKKWADVLKRVKGFWEHHWDEGGAIQTARECCKYVTKPAEMLKLTPAELGELYRQTRRMKLVQTMGALKKEIADRDGAGDVLRKIRTPNGEGRVYGVAKNHNRQRKRTTAEKNFQAAQAFDAKEAGDFFRVMSRSAPAFRGAGLKECAVVIMASRFDEERVRSHPDVARLIEATRDAWLAGLYIRVHTCTPTVRGAAPPETCSQRLLPEIIAR